MSIEVYFYNKCIEAGMTKEAAVSLMSQIKRESGWNPKNLEDTGNRKLGLSDEQYTAMVDSGQYQNFVHDGCGYGLPQITFWQRKEWFLSFAKNYGSSIGDYQMQTAYILWELYNKYRSIWNQLTTSHDIQALTWLLLDKWENPAEKTENMQLRYAYALAYYNVVKNAGDVQKEDAREDQPDENISKKYTDIAVMIANDNHHGYSQKDRWGPDYDCSSLVITCVQAAGIPVKDKGATYTGNMRSVFTACGFRDVTASCNLANGAGMCVGDILLNDVNHTAIYIGNGQLVHARSSEGNSIQGDQSGNEIRVQNYYNYPWNVILRYGNGGGTAIPSGNNTASNTVPILNKGSRGANVKVLQEKLIELGYDVGPDGADGDFGENTAMALMKFQKEHGLEVDGVFGAETFAAMKNAKPRTQPTSEPAKPSQTPITYIPVGKNVLFTGDVCYTGFNKDITRACKHGKAKITQVKPGAKHPYYLVRVLFGGSNVRGWVNREDFEVI